jgi:HNH endonuclease
VTKQRFAVDHVLPFSLWRSNELWNLLPANPVVNGRKSDRLPERRFLLGRRSAVVSCWNVARTQRPQRFEREAEALAGVARAPLNELFDAMVEAVEVTALQRGAERWAP